MSRITSDLLNSAPPELRLELEKVRDWLDKRKRVRFIEPGRLLREIGDADLVKLVRALLYLQENDFLRQVYRVKAPNGTILEDNYESPINIPKTVPDQFHREMIDTDEADIVTGFMVEGSGGEG